MDAPQPDSGAGSLEADAESSLELISQRAQDVLRSERGRRALGDEFGASMLLLLVFPAFYLLYLGMGWVGDAEPPRLPGWAIFGATFLPPLAWLLTVVMAARRRPVGRPQALAFVDDQLQLHDRMGAAAEFLETKVRSPFMDAAIADAAEHFERAKSAPLAPADPQWRYSRASLVAACLGILLAMACVFFPYRNEKAGRSNDLAAARTIAEIETDAAKDDEDDDDRETLVDEDPSESTREAPGARKGEPKARLEDQSLADDVKETQGATGSGSSSDASASSGSSQSQGAASQQAQASINPEKKAKKKKTKKPKKKSPEASSDKKPENEKSGATAGKGSATGSNKSPAASEWSSKDQVTSEDEEDLDTEPEVEDEDEENEARGGLQPSLRDRRPPVNRDLGIGFGNQKNPDANGRGGPSEQKKSRGVATLVLGVPIPDHIKGRPSPGRTKITQERIEPKPDQVSRIGAQKRSPRKAPAGHVASPDLLPWMRTLVKNYYLRVRGQLD
ncbi:MAG: hypothetical protein V3W41_08940 [Planctomycetota bacterium]